MRNALAEQGKWTENPCTLDVLQQLGDVWEKYCFVFSTRNLLLGCPQLVCVSLLIELFGKDACWGALRGVGGVALGPSTAADLLLGHFVHM